MVRRGSFFRRGEVLDVDFETEVVLRRREVFFR